MLQVPSAVKLHGVGEGHQVLKHLLTPPELCRAETTLVPSAPPLLTQTMHPTDPSSSQGKLLP